MKKTVLLVILFVLLLSPILNASEDEVILKPVKPGEWSMQSKDGQRIGTLRTMEEGAYSVQLPNGEYMGIILKSGELKKPGRHPSITPDEAKLYIEIWEAIRKLPR